MWKPIVRVWIIAVLLLAGCQKESEMDLQSALLIRDWKAEQTWIYWWSDLWGPRKRTLITDRQGIYPVGWTPGGKHMVWSDSQGKTWWVSDPCGQGSLQFVIDLSAYPNWELAPAGIYWLDDVLLLNMRSTSYQPDQPCCYIWKIKIGGKKSPTVWLTNYAVEDVLAPHLLVLWDVAKQQYMFWTPHGTFPLPRSWSGFTPGYLSPNEQWMAWEGDEGVYIGKFDPTQGVLSEYKVPASSQFRLLGWQSTSLRLVLYRDILLDHNLAAHHFLFWDPQTRKQQRLVLRHVPFQTNVLLSPDGRWIVSTWSRDFIQHVSAWDLQQGYQIQLLQEYRGAYFYYDWKRIDLNQCPNPPAIR